MNWLLSDYRCPIAANCPITLSDYNFADKLEQNTAVNATKTFEQIVIVMINGIAITPITFEEIVIVIIYPLIMTITISSNVIGV